MDGTKSLGSARERLAAMPFADLVSLFGRWIDFTVLDFSDQRRWLFPYQATFWLYLAQLLSPGMSGAEAVKMAAASLLFAGRKAPSPNSSAYCQARKRLPCRIVAAIGSTAALPTSRSSPARPSIWWSARTPRSRRAWCVAAALADGTSSAIGAEPMPPAWASDGPPGDASLRRIPCARSR